MGGRVIFKPEVFDLGFRESVGFPFFPLPSVGFRVGLSPEGGRVKPLPDKGLALIVGGEGGDGGKDGASSCPVLSTEACGSSAIGAGGAMPEGAGGGKEDSSSSPKDGNGGAFSWSVLSVGTSISSAVEAGRFMPKGAGGGKEGSPSSPKDGIGGISSRSMLSISCSDESKGAGENWGRGGNRSSLFSEVCDS